jgi:hypothetical protein
MRHAAFALLGVFVIMGGIADGCATRKPENTSVKNTVYILESVKDLPTGQVFSFRDYCAFNAERGAEDSGLDRTLAEADAWLELHFFDGTAELRLESSIVGNESGIGNENGGTDTAFLEYQKHYASRFFFTENRESVELALSLDSLDPETRSAVESMSDTERDAVLKSVFLKLGDTLVEPDEEDDVTNYWRRAR